MNIIWGIMIISGIFFSLLSGNSENLTNSILNSAKEAVTISFTTCGIMSLWCGLTRIAERSGLIDSITKLLMPVMSILFPEIPKTHPAIKHICTNVTANIFGLGWAATPSGLEAMKNLSLLNGHSKTASDSICMFLVINMSSVQLITVNIIAYRAEFGSFSPAAIVFPGIIATSISTLIGILSVNICRRCTRL